MAEDIKNVFDKMLDELESKLDEKKKLWSQTLINLSGRLKNKEPRELVELQAEVISQKQNLIDEMAEYAVKLAKDVSKKKVLYKQHFENYKQTYSIKTNVGELGKLIEAELAMHERKLNIYEIYIEFLKDTGKNFEQLNYGIKNKIELVNIFGID